MAMTQSDPCRVTLLYALALRLYPSRFRQAYAAAMSQTLCDARRNGLLPPGALFLLVLKDIAISVPREYLAMLRETFARPALIFNALILSGISTVLALALYSIPQQVLRQGANDPQIQLAGDAVARLEQGMAPADAIPVAHVDMARSLAPFVIAYDDQGRPQASQATLNGVTPIPPRGIFEYVRIHGEERISWQPVLGSAHPVRIAAVVQRVAGVHPGFVLAGRSLREVEARELQVERMAGLAWIGMLGLILVGTVAFGWISRKRPA